MTLHVSEASVLSESAVMKGKLSNVASAANGVLVHNSHKPTGLKLICFLFIREFLMKNDADFSSYL